MKYTLVFIIIFFTSITCSFAQQLKFEHYNDGDGLSHNSVKGIVQDKNGFLWFGTFSGLSRFDGYQFKNYTSDSGENSIKNNDITALEYDESNDNLWIGTRGGLTVLKLDTHEFKTFLPDNNNPNSLKDAEIRSVYLDAFERVWVGTRTKGVFVLYPKEERFVKVEIEEFNYIKEIYEDTKGNIWIGSKGTASIAKIKLDSHGEIYDIKPYPLSIPNSDAKYPFLNFIYEDGKSDIFAGTREGLYKLNIETDTFENIQIKNNEIKDKFNPYFRNIARAPNNGKYWIGTSRGLIVCDQLEDLERGDFQWYYSVVSENTSLEDNLISSLYFDTSGVLWIGTDDGLNTYDPFVNQFGANKDISRYIGNHAPGIKGFAKTYNSKVIVATQRDGLFILENNKYIPLFKGQHQISNIYSTDGKVFYCGLWNGDLLIYNYINNTSKVVPTSIEKVPILAIASYSDTEIIIGSYGRGAVVLDKRTFQISSVDLFPENGSSEGNEISKIVNDGAGNLWISTQAGMVKYTINSKKTSWYTSGKNEEFGLPHNEVSDVVIDSKNNIWVGTRTGLAKYDAVIDRFVAVSNHTEIVGKWIVQMMLFNEHDLWLNLNNNNIAKYDIKHETMNIYHVEIGNKNNIYSNRNGLFNLNNERIFLGGKYGVIDFSLDELKDNKWSPAAVITEFKIQNKEILPGTEVNEQIPLKFDLNYQKEVELDFVNRNFSIQFSAPSFSNKKLNKFRYMLEGFENDWIETASNVRTIQYTNLSPNEYIFKVKASNSDGEWSEISSYKIKILPTFWLSNQGLLLIFSILIVGSYLVSRLVKIRLRLKRELLKEKIERDRDEKLNDEKLQFFTNISHEFRTPLTLISGPLEQLLSDYKGSHMMYKKLMVIENSTNHLLKLINRLMDFRKLENKKFQLRSSKGNIAEFLKEIHLSFSEHASQGNYDYSLTTSDNEIIAYYDKLKLERIFYNLISNAFRYTPKGGTIQLKLEKSVNDISISVLDNGVGIAEEHIDKIFDRFFEVPIHNNPKTNYSKGTGIGLSIAKNLVELHKGTIEVENREAKGVIFKVVLPLGKEHLKPNEILNGFKVKDDVNEYKVQMEGASNEIGHDVNGCIIKEGKPTILIVEDNNPMRSFIKDILHIDYNIIEAENGKIALNKAINQLPDLIVSDVVMPEMVGTELCAKIKENLKTSHIPVILLTSRSSSTFKFEGLEQGADGYISKPFSVKEFKLKVKNILKASERLRTKFSNENNFVPSDIVISSVDEELLKKAFKIVEENIDNDQFDTSSFCKELGISRTMLFTKIKAWTNYTPNDFILEIRMKRAAQLLEQNKINISEVCYSVGFRSPKYFGKLFRKKFGESPSDYKNKFSSVIKELKVLSQ